MDIKIVGNIKFHGKVLPIYRSLIEPLFKVSDVASIFEDSSELVWNISQTCGKGEQLVIDNGKSRVVYLTDIGIYNLLAQIPTADARAWKFMVHEEFSDIIDEKRRKDSIRKEGERKKAEREAREEEKRRLKELAKNSKNINRKEKKS